ncbi:MAG: MFS transporter, partial [Deltaproteobacteria bacterium]|nr:MFS transporter [Deltaproteobacteria bacterium]
MRPGLVRELRLFHLYRLLATSYFFLPTFMLFQAERGLTFGERLGLAGLYSATIVLVEVPTGVFADRVGRRRAMIVGSVAMVVSCAVAVGAHGFGAFAVAECLAALSMALSSGADSAYLHDLLQAHGRSADYRRHEGIASAAHLVGSAAAALLGGVLAAGDLALPYVATAAAAACAGL